MKSKSGIKCKENNNSDENMNNGLKIGVTDEDSDSQVTSVGYNAFVYCIHGSLQVKKYRLFVKYHVLYKSREKESYV